MGNRILLADKSITIQKIVQLTFADDNYQIHSVSDGQAALEAIPEFRPDLILADISLPLRSGYEICSTVRADPRFSEFSETPVILLAGIYETMDEERAKQVEEKVRSVHASDFLSKPFDPQLLISKVKRHMSGTKPASPPEQPVFAQEADEAIHLSENDISTAPPDDGERTMMLPGGPFGNIFADSLPQEETTPEPPRPSVDVDSVKPVGEVIFGEEEFPPVELGSEDEQETVNLPSAAPDLGEAFQGREEQEFDYTQSDVQQASAPIQFVVPEAEEPFSDVFPDPSQAVQWNASSEEDSPFGVPEPPPAPTPKTIEPTPQFVESPITAPAETKAEAPSLEVEGFDDTWPGVNLRMSAAQPVEELFEAEASPVLTEDVEELEPDLSEGTVEEALEEHPEPVIAPQKTVAPAQFSEELIDRIAERVVSKLSERLVSEIVWQVVPDLAEKMIRRELEKLHAGEE